MEKKTHGGARAGAGRKRINESKYVSKSVSLLEEKWEQLEIKAKELGTTKNKLVANLVEEFLGKNK